MRISNEFFIKKNVDFNIEHGSYIDICEITMFPDDYIRVKFFNIDLLFNDKTYLNVCINNESFKFSMNQMDINQNKYKDNIIEIAIILKLI